MGCWTRVDRGGAGPTSLTRKMARVSSFRYASLPSYLGPMTTAPIRVATSLPARTFALEIEVPSSAVVWPGVTIAIEGTCMHLTMASSIPVVPWIVTSVNCLRLTAAPQ